MNFDLPPEQQTFLKEVQTFLDANDDPEIFDVTRENMAQIVDTPKRRGLMKQLGEQGWLGDLVEPAAQTREDRPVSADRWARQVWLHQREQGLRLADGI